MTRNSRSILRTEPGFVMLAILIEIIQQSKATDIPVSLPRVSAATGISKTYVEKSAGTLLRRKIIKGFRGSKGGYIVARPPTEISVAEVMEPDTSDDRAPIYSNKLTVNFRADLADLNQLILERLSVADVMEGNLFDRLLAGKLVEILKEAEG